MRRVRQYIGVAVALGALCFAPISAIAVPSPVLLISELQTGSSTSANEEFIEIVNAGSESADVSEFRIEYFSASTKDFDVPSRVIPLNGILPAGKKYLLASTGYLVGSANDSFSAGFAAAGGHLRLVSNNPDDTSRPILHDLLAWGSASFPEATAAKAPSAGSSLVRKTDQAESYVDTNDNMSDFEVAVPSPEGHVRVPGTVDTNMPEAPTAENVTPETQLSSENSTPSNNGNNELSDVEVALQPQTQAFAQLQITELLPNPAAPQSDSEDEFIELFNPTSETVELRGYKLQTGSNYSYSYTFEDQTIGANEYVAFYIKDTGLILANTAGKARLFDPAGKIVSEALAYGAADDGLSWAWDGAIWQWTSAPTPNKANVIAGAVLASTTAKQATSKTAAPKTAKSTKKASTTSKPKSTKVAAAKSAKNDKPASVSGSTQQPQRNINSWLLYAGGGLVLGYGLYEYRHDLKNALRRLTRRARPSAISAKQTSKQA